MKRDLYIFLFALLFILAGVKRVDASIVTIDKTGKVSLNVLSAEISSEVANPIESVEISKSSVEMGNGDMPISLFRKDGRYILNVEGKNGEKSFDVTDYKQDILEIEERPTVKKIAISLLNDRFVIEQKGIKAATSYQINIEPERSKITILTSSGYKFLTLLPKDAVDILFKTNTISSLDDNTVEILEDINGNLYYDAKGSKRIGIKDIYTLDVPVTAKISAVSGEVMEVDQPIWLKIISLFQLQS